MITIFRPRFRSRDAAIAAATRLTHLVPGHDYEAWPNRGYWVLVMRYRDDNGHIRFKFVGPADLLSKKHNIQEKTRAPEGQQILSPDNLAAEGKPPAARKPQGRPVAHNIGDRGDESVRRHRRVYAEAMH